MRPRIIMQTLEVIKQLVLTQNNKKYTNRPYRPNPTPKQEKFQTVVFRLHQGEKTAKAFFGMRKNQLKSAVNFAGRTPWRTAA